MCIIPIGFGAFTKNLGYELDESDYLSKLSLSFLISSYVKTIPYLAIISFSLSKSNVRKIVFPKTFL